MARSYLKIWIVQTGSYAQDPKLDKQDIRFLEGKVKMFITTSQLRMKFIPPDYAVLSMSTLTMG